MENKKYKPLFDKLFWIIFVPTVMALIALTVIASFRPTMLSVVIPVDIFVLCFLLSPLFGYAELREDSLFIRFGFVLKKEIPYNRIRGITKERKFYSDSMLSLKNAFDHVNIKYNFCDTVTVSVVENEVFANELEDRIARRSL